MQEYVLGFLFNEDKSLVALIKKTKPEWQSGFWNGIGGKVEKGESSIVAMIREFEEETSLSGINWESYCRISAPDHKVHCYRATCNFLYKVKSMTEDVRDVNDIPTISNTLWLMHLAIDTNPFFSEIEY